MGCRGGAEGLRGASGAAVQPKGAVQGTVAGVLRPRRAETVPWTMHAGCGGGGVGIICGEVGLEMLMRICTGGHLRGNF